MKNGDWRLVAALYGFGMAAAAAMGMMGPLVGDIATALKVSIGVAGGALLFQLLPGTVAGSAVGALIDRMGAKRILLLGAVVLVLADISQAFVANIVWFCINLVIQGLAVSAVMAAAQVMIAAASEGSRQIRNLTIWSTVNFVGYAAGLELAAATAGGAHWRYAFALHAGLAALPPLIGLTLPTVRAAVGKTDLLAGLKELSIVRIGLALGMASIAGVGTNAGISLYLHRVHDAPLSFTASLAAFGNLLSMIGSFGIAWLLAKGAPPRRLAALISATAIASGLVLYYPAASMVLAIPMLFISQSCASAITALTYTSIPRALQNPDRLGAATGLVVQVGGAGAMLGPPLYFAVLASNQWAPIAVVLAVLWGASYLLMPFSTATNFGMAASRPAGPS